MADQEVVIIGEDGTEHVFPAGFDPKKAAGIVRNAPLMAANAKPLQETTDPIAAAGASLRDTAGRTGMAIFGSVKDAATGAYDALKSRANGDIVMPGQTPSDKSYGDQLRETGHNVVEGVKNLSTPEGGGHAIGTLMLALAAGRVPDAVSGTRTGMYRAGQGMQTAADAIKRETAGHGYHPTARTARLGLDVAGKGLEALGKRPIPPVGELPLAEGMADPNWRTATTQAPEGFTPAAEPMAGGNPNWRSATTETPEGAPSVAEPMPGGNPNWQSATLEKPRMRAQDGGLVPAGPPQIEHAGRAFNPTQFGDASTGDLISALQSPSQAIRQAAIAELRKRGMTRGME